MYIYNTILVKTILVQLVNKKTNTKEAKHTYSKIKHIKHQHHLNQAEEKKTNQFEVPTQRCSEAVHSE